jgi:hypothetical protein
MSLKYLNLYHQKMRMKKKQLLLGHKEIRLKPGMYNKIKNYFKFKLKVTQVYAIYLSNHLMIIVF